MGTSIYRKLYGIVHVQSALFWLNWLNPGFLLACRNVGISDAKQYWVYSSMLLESDCGWITGSADIQDIFAMLCPQIDGTENPLR